MPLPVLFVALIATLLSDTFLKIIHTYKPGKAVFGFEYTDAENKDKDAYYYVRVLQNDGEMAWGSPVWITYK
jgi:hypothetical protein